MPLISSLRQINKNNYSGKESDLKARYFKGFAVIFIFSFICSASGQTIEWFTMGGGLSSSASAVAVLNNDIYVGGDFALAGGTLVNGIAKWDGSSWSALASGTDGGITALAVIGNDIYAAGFFSAAGGVPVNNIAKWDGSAWSALGQGVNELVLCLAVNGTDLYAGGFFTQAGGAPAARIAKWNGVSWSPLGTGINNEVDAIAVSGNDVYAGGIFNNAGGTTVSSLARWDGYSWFDVGGGVIGIVRAISVAGNDVYIGGVFTDRILRWDGSAWHTLGSGLDGSVFSMKQSANDLYVGGQFTNAGGLVVNHIAKFNMINQTWSPIGEGATGSVDAMAIQGSTNSMVIAGAFSHVGNNILANYVARFTDTENPLPVELTSFTASLAGNSINLNWSTATETNNKGFGIERASSLQNGTLPDQKNWLGIGFIKGNGTTTDSKHYSYTDYNLKAGIYSYRLKQIDYNGASRYSNEIEVNFKGSRRYVLEQNYPNPFNPSTSIKYSLPQAGNVKLSVYDGTGREIETLINKWQTAGNYTIKFNASRFSSGIYFYRLSTNGFSYTKKLILLK